MAKRYFSAAPRVETPDADGALVKVFPSSGAAVGEHDGPFVWLDIIASPERGSACAHLTVEQARVIRDALSTFISVESAGSERPSSDATPKNDETNPAWLLDRLAEARTRISELEGALAGRAADAETET